MFEKLFKRKEEEPLIHPDFNVRDPEDFWWWNYTELSEYLRRAGKKTGGLLGPGDIVKVAFPFDDPALLDNCPFMCKIGKNITSQSDTKWFGVAYGYRDDVEALTSWASRFPRHELITSTTSTGATYNVPPSERAKKGKTTTE